MSHKTYDISIIDSIENIIFYIQHPPWDCINKKTALGCFFVSAKSI